MSGEYEQVRGALAPGVRAVLDRATAADPARRYADVAAFGQALTDALGAPASPLLDDTGIENPYKGLRAFGPADAGEFFGRERLVERLIARLGAPGIRGRFVAVVGPSGSGKSSVVRAGLLPALAKGRAADVGGLVPDRHDTGPAPVRGARGGARCASRRTHRPRCSTWCSRPGGVRRAVDRVLPDRPRPAAAGHRPVRGAVHAGRRRHRDPVHRRARRRSSPRRARGSVSSSRCAPTSTTGRCGTAALGELLRDGTEVITPMSIDELEAAITGPAAKVGVDVEPARRLGDGGRDRRPRRRPAAAAVHADRAVRAPGSAARSRSPPIAPAAACRGRWPGGPTRCSPGSARR